MVFEKWSLKDRHVPKMGGPRNIFGGPKVLLTTTQVCDHRYHWKAYFKDHHLAKFQDNHSNRSREMEPEGATGL